MPESAENIPESENKPETELVFDVGAFTITNISPSPEGFKIVNRVSRRRRDAGGKFPLNTEEVSTLRDRMREEVSFALRKADEEAQKQERERTTKDYVQAMNPLVGIRNIHQNGNRLSIDTRPVSFPVYSDLVRKETSSPDLLDFGEASGTAAAIFTKDGKLLVQYRGKGNRAYKNIPGASAAGLLNGAYSENEPGTLRSVDSEYITENLLKEIEEELQTDQDCVETKTVAIAHDQIKPHEEFLITATVDQTAEQLEEKGLIPDDIEGHDFKERFFTIDGTPEAIEKLLTEVRCPLPPTHSAVFLMAGYNKVLEAKGKGAADSWAQRVSLGIKANYEYIDETVRQRYEQFPAQSGDLPKRSEIGYDPLYSPEDQGLASLLDELKRTELILIPMYEKLKQKFTE